MDIRFVWFTMTILTCCLVTSAWGWTHPSSLESPYIEARLWCPQDIDRLYYEMVAFEESHLPERVDIEFESEQRMREWVAEHPYLGFFARLNLLVSDAIGSMVQINHTRDSEIMRKVAYNILHDWPAATEGVTDIMGDFNGDEKNYGIVALRDMWRQWKAEWDRIRQKALAFFPEDVEGDIDNFAIRWGMHAEKGYPDVPNPVPSGWLSEDVNCTWYMCVERYDDTYDFHAVFEKKGPLLGDWDGSNTEVISHFASADVAQQGPYPGEMGFIFPKSSKYIYFTESSFYYARKDSKWLSIVPEPYPGRPGVITFKVRYPMREGGDYNNPQWGYADGVVMSEPDQDFMRVFNRIK